jgi:hypothetical protein
VKAAPHHDAAHEVVDKVLSEDGQAKLQAAGFGPP